MNTGQGICKQQYEQTGKKVNNNMNTGQGNNVRETSKQQVRETWKQQYEQTGQGNK